MPLQLNEKNRRGSRPFSAFDFGMMMQLRHESEESNQHHKFSESTEGRLGPVPAVVHALTCSPWPSLPPFVYKPANPLTGKILAFGAATNFSEDTGEKEASVSLSIFFLMQMLEVCHFILILWFGIGSFVEPNPRNCKLSLLWIFNQFLPPNAFDNRTKSET